MSIARAIRQSDRRTYVKCQKMHTRQTLTVMLACISYFLPFFPMNRQLSSSTLAVTIWNRSWFFENTDSNVLISCLRVFRQAIWLVVSRYRTILAMVWGWSPPHKILNNTNLHGWDEMFALIKPFTPYTHQNGWRRERQHKRISSGRLGQVRSFKFSQLNDNGTGPFNFLPARLIHSGPWNMDETFHFNRN